jgi:small-conductance mechanosensitive channel
MNKITKLTYFAVVTSLLSNTAIAEEASLTDRVQGCVKITQDTARLACFDQLIMKHNNQSIDLAVTQLATPRVDSEVTELTAQQIDSFSKEQVKKTAEESAKEINSITLTISKLSKTPYGQWKITFENGQKWKQKDNDKLSLKTGQRVILTKGSLKSVFLQKENTAKRIKVKRLK